MIKITGQYNTATIFTDNVEEDAKKQIESFCNMECFKDSAIRIMPDVHCGKGCTIGTTMTIEDKIIPNHVGVDLGCGVDVVKIKEKNIDFEKLDNFIKNNIPHGFSIRNNIHKDADFNLEKLKCIHIFEDLGKVYRALGTLGGGNHFIEMDKSSTQDYYLVVHCGSRNPGLKLANYYQSLTAETGTLYGQSFDDYISDSFIMNKFAQLNRKLIIKDIVDYMGFNVCDEFETIHNYVSYDNNNLIMRKGAVDASLNKKLIIPMNMRDGSLICIGRGNPEWNYSAPHGAGRLMSRTEAKKQLSMSDFKDNMNGIYTTTVNEGTLDESPMAYKPMEEIVENVKDTVDIIEIIKPVYNFKSDQGA